MITDDAILARPGFSRVASWLLEAGRDEVALHLRGPRTAGRSLYDHAQALLPMARAHGALLVINDRLDVALAAGADAVQLGARSLTLSDAREAVARTVGSSPGPGEAASRQAGSGPAGSGQAASGQVASGQAATGPPGSRLRFGVSVHGVDEAREALDADWWLVGTLWQTASHPGRPGAGVERLRDVGAAGPVPCIGIGGVTAEHVAPAMRAGAAGVAVLGGIWHSPDPVTALNIYLEQGQDP